MKKRIVHWTWEDPEAQALLADWVGFPDEAQTSLEVDQIERLLRLQPPLSILDVGCGTGRHALEFARRGCRVVGIDIAEIYLQQARQQAADRSLNVEFRLQRGADLAEREVYDLALAYNHTLGFMSDPELQGHFHSLRQALKPGGHLLLVLAGPKLAPGAETAKRRDWAERDGRYILREKSSEGGYRTESGIVIDTVKDDVIKYHERQRAFALEAVQALLLAAGLVRVECYANLEPVAATPADFGVFVAHR